MPVILDSEKTSHFIEKIFRNAEETLSIMLPVFRLSAPLYELLQDASGRGVQITIIFSSDELEPYEKKAISELEKIEICCCAELNSKCCFNENSMIITSADLHNCHEKKNGDISVAISRDEDKVLYNDVLNLYNSFHESSIILISEKGSSAAEPVQTAAAYHGFCIRCAMPITFRLVRPYCRQCMNEVKKETLSNIEENYCHSCARKAPATLNSPLCKDCFNSYNNQQN